MIWYRVQKFPSGFSPNFTLNAHTLRAGKMKTCNQTIAKVLCTPTKGVFKLNIFLSLDHEKPAACKTHFVL
jgi:hypothetical protein